MLHSVYEGSFGLWGIFCVSFATPCLNWLVYSKIWCSKCYCVAYTDSYMVQQPVDKDGAPLEELEDDTHYIEGCDGDHLMMVFQCDLCQL